MISSAVRRSRGSQAECAAPSLLHCGQPAAEFRHTKVNTRRHVLKFFTFTVALEKKEYILIRALGT